MTTFNVTLRTKEGDDDSIRTLRAALKVLGRRFGLRAIRVEEQQVVDRASPKKRIVREGP
jgi:hypothetical protein